MVRFFGLRQRCGSVGVHLNCVRKTIPADNTEIRYEWLFVQLKMECRRANRILILSPLSNFLFLAFHSPYSRHKRRCTISLFDLIHVCNLFSSYFALAVAMATTFFLVCICVCVFHASIMHPHALSWIESIDKVFREKKTSYLLLPFGSLRASSYKLTIENRGHLFASSQTSICLFWYSDFVSAKSFTRIAIKLCVHNVCSVCVSRIACSVWTWADARWSRRTRFRREKKETTGRLGGADD